MMHAFMRVLIKVASNGCRKNRILSKLRNINMNKLNISNDVQWSK